MKWHSRIFNEQATPFCRALRLLRTLSPPYYQSYSNTHLAIAANSLLGQCFFHSRFLPLPSSLVLTYNLSLSFLSGCHVLLLKPFYSSPFFSPKLWKLIGIIFQYLVHMQYVWLLGFSVTLIFSVMLQMSDSEAY